MKKNISVLLFIFLSSIAFGQVEWNVNYYNDEFGDPDPSAGGYVSTIISDGTFSNSATTNSKLAVVFFAENYQGKVINSLKLAEYGSSLVKAYSSEYYSVKIKDDSGTIHTLKLMITEGSDTMYDFDGEINNLILNNKVLKFHIKEVTDGYASSYKFSIATEGYSSATSKIK